ncbi:peptide chain release factor N(5)-glutamine methyltransferase [Ornithinimicrobium tianjinense]|uniref:Release factor glutamine methyltransferase n=1 Tax=Ornithinimicrobium tianjinense TaxID=1195761 RepID=A0A917BHG0_9MICO|nr:peptide chain release factor N(5)-glutamine methyltransferase [Ornithinimicrobium tianjinense]GGF41262.1 release factor glutamine methyltransferase [Ornithinimicrobium tianjinense]
MTFTLDRVLRSAAAQLGDAGVPSPAVDAEVLLAHVLGVDLPDLRRSRLMGELLPEGADTAYQDLLVRRATRVPLQHLTGTASFAGLDLQVGPGVFVPRPETELLVELAVAALEDLDAPTVVDLCTGSGAVALGVARRRPDARVGAVELSPDAHRYAVANVSRSGLAVDLRLGPAQEAFGDWLGQVDVVTSNPPYIPPGMVPVDVEVREHDPELALYGGGEDGLDVPREVAARAAELLRPGGVLLMEHADVQGVTLPATLMAAGCWASADDHRDLAGLPRVTRAVRTR